MPALRLARLPDRTTVRLIVQVSPELQRALDDYARLYQADYGREEPIAALVPAMLDAFLASDRQFQRRRGEGQDRT